MLRDVAATWIWWGTAIFVVLAVGRYAITSRRHGRKPRLSWIALAVAAPIAAAVLSRTNSPWQALVGLAVPALFAWAWFRRDRARLELGPSPFAVDIWAQLIDPPSPFGISIKGRVRLLAGEGQIATRPVTKWGATAPSWLDNFGMLTYTFRAADCEAERPRMGVSSFLVSLGKPAIVLRGVDPRREVELALARPSGATLEDVQLALLRAGARPIDGQSVPPLSESVEVAPTPARRPQPPYWPPPPGWHPDADRGI